MLQRDVSRLGRVRVGVTLGVSFSFTGANLWLIRDNWKLKW